MGSHAEEMILRKKTCSGDNLEIANMNNKKILITIEITFMIRRSSQRRTKETITNKEFPKKRSVLKWHVMSQQSQKRLFLKIYLRKKKSE